MNNGVSVIITLRGSDRFLRGAIDTLLQQHYRPLELVLVDDGIDWQHCNRGHIEKTCKESNIQTRFVERSAPGRAHALNVGIEHASHDWIAILDVDDRWHTRKLELQLAFLEQVPFGTHQTILGTAALDVLVLDIESHDNRKLDRIEKLAHTIDVTRDVLAHCPLTHSSVVFHRCVWRNIDGYDESRNSQIDWDFFGRAVMSGASLIKIGHILVFKAQHSEQAFEARKRLSYLWRSLLLQHQLQKHLHAPLTYRWAMLRRALIALLPRRLKWWLQQHFSRRHPRQGND